MAENRKWETQETLALAWLVAAIVLVVLFSIWQSISLPLFTLIFLAVPLIILIIRKDEKKIGMGKISFLQILRWTGINFGAFVLIYAAFEPWSGAYAFLLEEATAAGTSDPTFMWLKLFDGFGGWLGMFLFSGLISIFAEEVFFRGWILQAFEPKVGWVWANLIQAALFTLPQLLVASLMPNLRMGLVYGLVYAFAGIGFINGWVSHRAGAIWPNLIAATVMNLVLGLIILL